MSTCKRRRERYLKRQYGCSAVHGAAQSPYTTRLHDDHCRRSRRDPRQQQNGDTGFKEIRPRMTRHDSGRHHDAQQKNSGGGRMSNEAGTQARHKSPGPKVRRARHTRNPERVFQLTPWEADRKRVPEMCQEARVRGRKRETAHVDYLFLTNVIELQGARRQRTTGPARAARLYPVRSA
jgi:hypothetical protein